MRRSTRKRLSTALSAALIAGLAVVAPTGAGAAGTPVVFDDFEDGDVSGWVFFDNGVDAGGGGGIASDRPAEESSYYFSTGWGGQGTTSGFYGGTFKNLDNAGQVTLPPDPVFNMWVLNQIDATVDEYVLELTLREDTDGNGWTDGAEDSIGLNTKFTSAKFDDTWTLLSAPLSSWTDKGTGGNGVFDGAVDEMVIVIGGVVGGPDTTVEVDFDTIAFTSGSTEPPAGPVIDDFESGVAPGTPCPPPTNAPPLGFCTFNGRGSSGSLANPATPPAPALPEAGTPNSVLQMDVDSTSFAGFIHGFSSTQDWSKREGVSLWMYGTGSGSQMFIDILDNRNDGSTVDDAERWSIAFLDDFSGWQLLEFPFADFVRKEIGNGAPNDGLGLVAMNGYALGPWARVAHAPTTSTTSRSTVSVCRRPWP